MKTFNELITEGISLNYVVGDFVATSDKYEPLEFGLDMNGVYKVIGINNGKTILLGSNGKNFSVPSDAVEFDSNINESTTVELVKGDSVVFNQGSKFDPFQYKIEVNRTYQVLKYNQGMVTINGADGTTFDLPRTCWKLSNNKY